MLRGIQVLAGLILLAFLTGCAGSSGADPRINAALDGPYRLDSGDSLRVVVFDQQNLTNAYVVDDSGRISMPLIGAVQARGRTTRELEGAIAAALRDGYLRDPSVSVQVEAYRPFFILGEVGSPGQFPYVSGMTARTAAAIAGGFTPRAVKSHVEITRTIDGRMVRARVPIDTPVGPGDTIHVLERWF
jgi:polysaccharide biosynthesis/export protein